MDKNFRIKKSKEIEQIMNCKKTYSSNIFRIFIKQNDETGHFRYAISVGKKIGNAVNRNYQKRRIRMLFNNYKDKIPSNLDIFLIAKSNINDVDFSDLEKNFLYLLNKISKK